MSVTITPFDTLHDGRAIRAFEITDGQNSVKLLELGGIVNRLCLPDREGKVTNVVCGFDRADTYLKDENHHGGLIGRFANRIRNSVFTLNGKTYQLASNEEGSVHLHGGMEGFDRKKWEGEVTGEQSVRFTYVSEDGEEGYPGRLTVKVDYTLKDGRLSIRYRAESDADTVVNLTNHAYFNLDGVGSGTVMQNLLTISADFYSPLDETLVPAGDPAPVEGTRFDFRKERPIAEPYDNNFIFHKTENEPVVTLRSLKSGRRIDLYTDQPEMQLYTAVMMKGERFENGQDQRFLEAVCLETQVRPDDPNRKDGIHDSYLRKGEVFDRTTTFVFSAE